MAASGFLVRRRAAGPFASDGLRPRSAAPFSISHQQAGRGARLRRRRRWLRWAAVSERQTRVRVRLRPWRTWTAGTRGARRRISRRVSWDGVKKRRWRLACESFVRGARQACHAGRRRPRPLRRLATAYWPLQPPSSAPPSPRCSPCDPSVRPRVASGGCARARGLRAARTPRSRIDEHHGPDCSDFRVETDG